MVQEVLQCTLPDLGVEVEHNVFGCSGTLRVC